MGNAKNKIDTKMVVNFIIGLRQVGKPQE